MQVLHIDIETYSTVDLTACGVHKYTEAREFKILLFAYAIDDQEVVVFDLENGEKIPDDIFKNRLVSAHNFEFEYLCLKKHGIDIIAESNKNVNCTAVTCAQFGFDRTLADASAQLNLPEDEHKKEGKSLIKTFCVPDKLGQKPKCEGEKWNEFMSYCKFDVEASRAIYKKLGNMQEVENYLTHIKINDAGILIDVPVVRGCYEIWEQEKIALNNKFLSLTGVKNPRSPLQLKSFFKTQNVHYTYISEIEDMELTGLAKEAYDIRNLISSAAPAKYETLINQVCEDGRLRGQYMFWGARTGRATSKGVQIQNLAKPTIKIDVDQVKKLILAKDVSTLLLYYPSITDILVSLLRNVFVARPGHSFINFDYAAIEARVIAWLAGEEWKNEIFRTTGKVYEATGAKIYGVPLEAVTKESKERLIGKISTLALGYQGWVGAMRNAMRQSGIPDSAFSDEQLTEICRGYRAANPRTVSFWYGANTAFDEKISLCTGKCKFFPRKQHMFVQKPNGQNLIYRNVQSKEGKISYLHGSNRVDVYGGKIVENICQSVAGDILKNSMLNIAKNFPETKVNTILHTHDEMVFEVPTDLANDKLFVSEIQRTIEDSPAWAKDLCLKTEYHISKYYTK